MFLRGGKNHVTTTATPQNRTHIKLAHSVARHASLSPNPLTLSGEIKTDQSVIFKSLNLYKIAARKQNKKRNAPQLSRCHKRCNSLIRYHSLPLSRSFSSSLSMSHSTSHFRAGIRAYNNNINTRLSSLLVG